MTIKTPRPISRKELPPHWIGVRADWQERLGRISDHLISLPPHELRMHALLLGATGSGKTNLLHHLIAQDIHFRKAFCVFDLRGDLVLTALELCAGRVHPDQIKLFDLRERNQPLGFNPLAGAGEPYFRALNLLNVLETDSESWGVQLAETLRNALLLLAEADQPLTKLELLFYDPAFLRRCLTVCESDAVLSFWRRFTQLSTEKQLSMAAPVLNKVSLLLATPGLRKTLGHPAPVDLGKHLNQPGAVTLVSLAVDELHGAGKKMGRLMLSSICREIFSRVSIPEADRNPVRLYVDEFEHFGLDEFETILAEGRRFGLTVVLCPPNSGATNPTDALLDPRRCGG